MGKHCCASVHRGQERERSAEHWEELLHLMLIKAPMVVKLCWKMLFSTFPYCTVLDVPHSHTSVVWCAGLGWILMAGSELVIHGFSSGAEVGWGVGIFLKCCVLKCQLYIELFLGGFLPLVLPLPVLWSAADSLSSPVAAPSPRAGFPQ